MFLIFLKNHHICESYEKKNIKYNLVALQVFVRQASIYYIYILGVAIGAPFFIYQYRN